jgi:hypothetical protein
MFVGYDGIHNQHVPLSSPAAIAVGCDPKDEALEFHDNSSSVVDVILPRMM